MTILSNTKYKWRMELLRKHGKIGEAKFKSCTIDFVESADVMRTMKVKIPVDGFEVNNVRIKQEEEQIYFDGTRCFDGSWCFASIVGIWVTTQNEFDMFSDRLRPVMTINDVDYDFGEFMIVAAPVEDDGKEYSYNIEAYDETMMLKQSALTSRLFFAKNTKYLSVISSLIADCGITRINYKDNNLRTTIDHEFAVGTSYLTIINQLLDEINYAHVHAGENGYMYLEENQTKIVADYVYSDDNSTLIDSIKRDTDIYSLPNVVIGFTSSPDAISSLRYQRVNSDPTSAISTVRRGYNVVETIELNDCPNYSVLQQVVNNRFVNVTQATETATVITMPDGNHLYGSFVSIGENTLNEVFREVGWSIEFGGQMIHNLERRVTV